MNKLISKNPIQRFKEGRKIVKAKGGLKTIQNSIYDSIYGTLWGLRHPIENTKRLFGNQSSVDQDKFAEKYLNEVSSDYDDNGNLIKKEQKKGRRFIDTSTGNEYWLGSDGSKTLLSSKKPIKTNGGKSRKTLKKVSTPSSVFAGHKIGRTGGLNYNIDDADRQQLIGTGQFTDSDFTNAISAQKALNRYFANSGLGSVTEDGAWGDQSRAALALALSKSKSLTPINNETTVAKTPIIPTYTPPTIPINQKVANLNLNVPTYVTADRSQTRDWMRSNNINPYSVTGAMRVAVRRIRAGQADDNDKLLVKGNEQLYNLLKGYYKKGGQLPSRNPVERFKQKQNLVK